MKNIVYDRYIKTYQKHGINSEALGWVSRDTQNIRFKTIKEIGIKSGESVLDVGCGFGDLHYYLKTQDVNVDYTGIDICDFFIEEAKKLQDTGCKFLVGDIFDNNINIHDWVVASGIFGLKITDWEENVLDTTKKMFELSKKGISVNFISHYRYHPYIEDDLNIEHVVPENLITKLIPILSNKFILRHDYTYDDFTLQFFK